MFLIPQVAYRDALLAWHDFYVTAGGAAAALTGLLFVGLSLHLRTVVAHPEVRSLARITLSNFFVVLLVALFCLIPTSEPVGTAVSLLSVAVGALVLLVPSGITGIRRRRAAAIGASVLARRFALSGLAYFALGGIALAIAFGQPETGLGWLVGTVAILLLVG